ncbi:lysophospholipid acyltransferase family protein [Streptomyces sp. NBC_01092]|uniref:lysophospholipid acyltransferase family protein n=1 Tax=Streptomyces sp. NBC_01092 TaxID=2903748 RepID=UPI003865C106|nr:1-acyl-sn-glycerol-3-phosphate acyltransferase [Streptomyces sp. NBC_01092]
MSTSSLGAVQVPPAIAPTAGTPAVGGTSHPADAGTLWRPSAPCTPRNCIDATGPARAMPLAVLRIAAVLLLLVLGFAATPLGGRIPAGLVRRWSRWVVRAAGVRVRIAGGTAPDGGLLLVANHVSWLDIPLLAAVRPARMLAKSEIRDWPVAGWMTARSGALFIDRDRIRALPVTVARIAEALRAGEAVTVFPEGSTWCGRAQGHFRRAAFQAALDAGVPVQPVRLSYRVVAGSPTTAAAFVGQDSLLASVWRVVRVRELVAEAEVREPIMPGSRPDRRSLADAAEASALPDERPVRIPRPQRAATGGPASGSEQRSSPSPSREPLTA